MAKDWKYAKTERFGHNLVIVLYNEETSEIKVEKYNAVEL